MYCVDKGVINLRWSYDLRFNLKRLTKVGVLTRIEVCCGPVVVQFRLQFFIPANHFDSFRVEINGVAKIFL